MTDIVDQATRSRMMSGIRSKNTQPEKRIRSLLHALGFRYRLHAAVMPGKPDLVFSRYRSVIFVHGCFWHGHNCPLFKMPATRSEFWEAKINKNRTNDQAATEALHDLGWRVAIVWECALRGRNRMDDQFIGVKLAEWLMSGHSDLEIRSIEH
jgi:DNA mismatch endonuclease, patch repair protein